MEDRMKKLKVPASGEAIADLQPGDMVELNGYIFTGRDAVLPKLVTCIQEGKLAHSGLDLQGSVIFHTAVSPAGIGPTSSNKVEIEGSIPVLSEAGVKIHLGKGALKPETVRALAENNAVYAVTPPVTALFGSRVDSVEVAAFPEEGMEALHLLKVHDFPAIIAAAHGRSIYD